MSKYFLLCGMLGLLPYGSDAQISPTDAIKITLPLAEQSEDPAGCHSLNALTDPGAIAYVEHLEGRFANRVVLCLTDTIAEAAQLMNDGETTLAWINQADAQASSDTWRAFLTLRGFDGLGRPPYVVFAGESVTEPGELDAAQIGFVSQEPQRLFVDMALETLQDLGLRLTSVEQDQRYPDVPSLFQAVRSTEKAAGVLDANAWGRNCGVLDPSYNPCDDFQVLYEGRPRADQAMVIGTEHASEFRYRMVSVHIALHMEAPEAFAWINQGQGSEFQPAEHDALTARPLVWTGSE